MPKVKNPNDPVSAPQKGLIAKLQAEKGIEPFAEETLDGMTKGQASSYIDGLLNPAFPAKPKLSLTEMAAQIEGGSKTFITAKGEALLAEHGVDPVAAAEQLAVLTVTKAEAKTLLGWYVVMQAEVDASEEDELLEQKLQLFLKPIDGVKPNFKPTAAEPVPAGYYAIGEPGDTKFYRVEYGKAGSKWEGFLFLSQQASEDFWAVKNPAAKAAVVAAIEAQGILESLTRYGHELGVCGICHKTLTDPQSIADGIGPVCKGKVA